MEPDIYRLSSAVPVTALSAWMTIANLTRDDLADEASLSRPTVTMARQGGNIHTGSAKLLSIATGLTSEVLTLGKKQRDWAFKKNEDGSVEVM